MIALLMLACAVSPPPYATYDDADGDGWDDAEDCAPYEPAVHPGAPDAACDGIDANCDGDAGDAVSCTAELADADGRWIATDGEHMVGAGIVDGRVWVSLQSAPGGAGVWRLPGDGSGGGDPEAGELVMAATDSDSISVVRPIPDVDGDGTDDAWILGNEVAWLISGAATGIGTGDALATLDNASHLWAAGDFDGDGTGDLFVHVGLEDLVFRGGDLTTPVLDTRNLGAPLTAADVDGDGLAELLGLQRNPNLRPEGVAVAPGGATGFLDFSYDATATWITSPHDPQALAAADFDGDGYGDVALGVADADHQDVWLLAGPIAPGMDVAQAAGHVTAADIGFFDGLDAVGDVDCDGAAELTVTWNDALSRQVTLVADPLAGTVALKSLTSWRSEYPNDGAGDTVAGGDLDGDGCADLVVTAPSYGNFDWGRQGAVYVLLGVP